MYSVCSRYYINKEDRMAALNMIFVRLVQGMNDYLKRHDAIPYEQWLRKVSINYIIDEFRKQKRYRELVSLQEDAPAEQLQYEEPENMFDKEAIMLAIGQLPPMCRTVFNLYAIDGYRHEEIAELLGISSGTSKSHLFKARRKLQEMLSGMNKNATWNKTIVQ
jgi:RNA polymerase sigma-70 factor (ECF subfamily)